MARNVSSCAFEMPNGWRMPLAQRYRRTHTQGQFRNGAAETQDVPAHPKPFHMTSKPTLQDYHLNPLLNSANPLACCRPADHSRSEVSRDTRCFDMRLQYHVGVCRSHTLQDVCFGGCASTVTSDILAGPGRRSRRSSGMSLGGGAAPIS